MTKLFGSAAAALDGLLKECTLPLTGKAVVDHIITNLGVLDVVEDGLRIVEVAKGVSEDDLRAATEATIV